jgi:hypothetical protein
MTRETQRSAAGRGGQAQKSEIGKQPEPAKREEEESILDDDEIDDEDDEDFDDDEE